MPRSALKSLHETLALATGLGMLGVACLLWSPLALILKMLLPERHGRALGRRVISLAFRGYLHVLGALNWVKVDLAALDNLARQPATIIAPNHPSLLDAVLIFSRIPDIGCIVKAPLLDHALLGAGARLAGYIPNHRCHDMIRLAVRELREGRHLLLFPEGTRTSRPPVDPLRSSPALIARRAGAPIQTLLIEMNVPFLGKHWPLLRRPSLPIVVHVRLGQRFPPPGEVRAFTGTLQRHFESELRPVSPEPATESLSICSANP
ncbi:hypothetical protein JCM19379_01810 [Methyloparacoccus murrellii]